MFYVLFAAVADKHFHFKDVSRPILVRFTAITTDFCWCFRIAGPKMAFGWTEIEMTLASKRRTSKIKACSFLSVISKSCHVL